MLYNIRFIQHPRIHVIDAWYSDSTIQWFNYNIAKNIDDKK